MIFRASSTEFRLINSVLLVECITIWILVALNYDPLTGVDDFPNKNNGSQKTNQRLFHICSSIEIDCWNWINAKYSICVCSCSVLISIRQQNESWTSLSTLTALTRFFSCYSLAQSLVRFYLNSLVSFGFRVKIQNVCDGNKKDTDVNNSIDVWCNVHEPTMTRAKRGKVENEVLKCKQSIRIEIEISLNNNRNTCSLCTFIGYKDWRCEYFTISISHVHFSYHCFGSRYFRI